MLPLQRTAHFNGILEHPSVARLSVETMFQRRARACRKSAGPRWQKWASRRCAVISKNHRWHTFYQNSPIPVARDASNNGIPLSDVDRSIDGKLTTILIFVVQDAEVTRTWVLSIYRDNVSPFSRRPVNELSHSVRT